MLIKKNNFNGHLTDSDVTDECIYRQRRHFMQTSAVLALGGSLPSLAYAYSNALMQKITTKTQGRFSTDEALNSLEEISTYNNFYELGTDKSDPAKNAGLLKTDPWSIEIAGKCNKPGTYTLEDILKPHDLEERIYRLRCVETWSMVIPWVGFSLADLLKRFEPTSDARYVAFETLFDQKNPLPGQTRPVLKWPYREGLRIDEAMNPLAFLAVGLYGKVLPNQNGAPIRLVVPWKYGFKSIKSIVKITFTTREPQTSWNLSAPSEYGFYSNVNPGVSHPRWSQRRERRIGEFLKRPTLMFNGYEEQVAALYKDMDLTRYY